MRRKNDWISGGKERIVEKEFFRREMGWYSKVMRDVGERERSWVYEGKESL